MKANQLQNVIKGETEDWITTLEETRQKSFNTVLASIKSFFNLSINSSIKEEYKTHSKEILSFLFWQLRLGGGTSLNVQFRGLGVTSNRPLKLMIFIAGSLASLKYQYLFF